MKFIPKYTVSYGGVFHPAGVPFEISEKDAGTMNAHGQIFFDEEKPARRPGRPRKSE